MRLNRKRWFSFLIVCLLLSAMILPVLGADSTVYGRYPSSSDNESSFVTDGTFFYYILDDWSNQTNEQKPFRIVRQSIQSGEQTVLYQGTLGDIWSRGSEIANLNYSNGWIYFTSKESLQVLNQYKINLYKMRTDGSEMTCIYSLNGYAISDMIIVNDKLYFRQSETKKTSDVCLASVNLDGSNFTVLVKEYFSLIYAYNRQLLLLNPTKKFIVCYDIDSGEQNAISLAHLGHPNTLQISSNQKLYIYFGPFFTSNKQGELEQMPSSFSSLEMDGTGVKDWDIVYDRYIIVGNEIFYYNHTDSNIYRRSLSDGSTSVKVTDTSVIENFYYHNGYLFTRNKENRWEVHIYLVGESEIMNPSETSTIPNFTDVLPNAYYAEAVQWAIEKKITSGTSSTTFSPDTNCTTAQILTFLWRSQGEPEPAIKNPFADISENDYFYKAALWANEKGLVSGSLFDGDTPCSRVMVVAYLWKLAGSPSAPAASFTDVPGNSEYAPAVAWAVQQGITSGTSATKFTPAQTCSRGQIVTFLYRAYGE